jgi:hypothetical protein
MDTHIKNIIEKTTNNKKTLAELEKIKKSIDDEINEHKNFLYQQKIKNNLIYYLEKGKITKDEYNELENIEIFINFEKTYTKYEQWRNDYYIICSRCAYNLKYESDEYEIRFGYWSGNMHCVDIYEKYKINELSISTGKLYKKLGLKHTRPQSFSRFLADLYDCENENYDFVGWLEFK